MFNSPTSTIRRVVREELKEELDNRGAILEEVLEILNGDPHSFSDRPCQTCGLVSRIAKKPYGCMKRSIDKAVRLGEHKPIGRMDNLTEASDNSLEEAAVIAQKELYKLVGLGANLDNRVPEMIAEKIREAKHEKVT